MTGQCKARRHHLQAHSEGCMGTTHVLLACPTTGAAGRTRTARLATPICNCSCALHLHKHEGPKFVASPDYGRSLFSQSLLRRCLDKDSGRHYGLKTISWHMTETHPHPSVLTFTEEAGL